MATDERPVYPPEPITLSLREQRLGQRGTVLWLTGLPGAGKTTLAGSLERRLFQAGHWVAVLDGDTLRRGLCADLGFDEAARAENVRRVAEVAALMADAGLLVVVALISPLTAFREQARALIGPERFLEIHVQASVGRCQARDPKGLYAKAKAGALSGLTGIDAPYEAPTAPALALNTEALDEDECVDALVDLLALRGRLSPPPERP